MSFKLSEIVSDAEFDELARCEFDAYENPACNLKQLFFPIVGSLPSAREDAIKEAVERQTMWHRADPTSKWIKVVDSESGKMAGAACWHVYEADPYAVVPEDECDWWAVGEDRNIANALMEQFLTPRMTYMRRPHVFLDILFTHPDFRRRGVGNMLMDWGIKQADAKGMEAYLDATDIGRELYRTWGFLEDKPKEFTVEEFEATPRRKELEKELLPFVWWPMHRPVGGKYEAGKGQLPWEKD